MTEPLATFLLWLSTGRLKGVPLINWGAPVPSFGDASTARVATLGLNPSNLEFVDRAGNELGGGERRFHTLRSLGIENWTDAGPEHLEKIWSYCQHYFSRNPYDAWFRQLEFVISKAGHSFYGPWASACHLDLIPFATSQKWTDLSSTQRRTLLSVSADSLGLILGASSIGCLILNGQGVVDHFQRISGTELLKVSMPSWRLPRRGEPVMGYAFSGEISAIGSVQLPRAVSVLGFNHNLQSSFGVTNDVRAAIRDWLAKGWKTIEARRSDSRETTAKRDSTVRAGSAVTWD